MARHFHSAPEEEMVITDDNLRRKRQWFRAAVDKWSDWRDEAREDYEFVAGKQWKNQDKQTLEQAGRPAITINKIKPLINVLSGYQRLNRYDIDFLPRTNDDMNLCQVRKGITKYVMDRCDYEYHESNAFLDGAIGGIGWLEVKYTFDQEIGDGEAEIVREDPLSMYVDPESRKPDFSDAKYIIRARWVDKDDLKLIYPEHADEIDKQQRIYDVDEDKDEYEGLEPLWYQKETKKLRLCECWYKVKEKETFYFLADGSQVSKAQVTIDLFLTGQVIGAKTIPVSKVKVCAFFDSVMLEDIDSPYSHGEFPFVAFTVFNFGQGDLPAGIIRDLKDPQREINKRRSQTLHVLNTSSNSGWITEDGAMTPDQERNFRNRAATPGAILHVSTGSLSSNRMQRLEAPNPPTALMEAEQQAQADLPSISGINEALMGTDIPASASGRAIEMKQKQAITHIAPMFDNLRKAKKRISYLLWGRRGHKGIIPQYYTEDKVYRIEGQGGPQFIRVNQQVQQEDPLKGTIKQTLNDLTEGEFDIIIADTEASTTQRQAQMWSLVDAVGKLGIPGDLVFDIILDLSDIPNKDDIKARWQQRQQQQAQAQQQQSQMQMQTEQMKLQAQANRFNNSINFKDAPPFIQLAMAAKDGLIDPKFAQYAIEQSLRQLYPEVSQQVEKEQFQQQQSQQEQKALQDQAQGQEQQEPQSGQELPSQAQQQTAQQKQSPALTHAALSSLRSGQVPAM